MQKRYLIPVLAIAVATSYLFNPILVVKAQETETVAVVKDTVITKRQWARSKKIRALKPSLRNAPKSVRGKTCKSRKSKKKHVVAGSGYTIYESATRDFNVIVSDEFEENEPLTLQTETINFPDGSMAHYTCHCEGTDSGEDVCQFGSQPGGEPDLNSCGGAECCGIVVHVIDANGTPIAEFPG